MLQKQPVETRSTKRNVQKFGTLAALTTQNTALILLTKFSYARVGATPYVSSTVIVCAEAVKLVVSSALLIHTEGNASAVATMWDLRSNSLSLALPSALYVIQNNLLFDAVRLLSPNLYMVCSQSKIFTSAFFSRLLLSTRITKRQSVALLILACGMILVRQSEGESSKQPTSEFVWTFKGDATHGLLAVFAATTISGFVGAYLEKMYRQSNNEKQLPSVWFRNTQLACFSLPVAIISAFWRDHMRIRSHGFFQGYDIIVFLIVLLQAVGGLVVAGVMRHAGNVLKCFAVSISMCNCAVVTVFFASVGGETHISVTALVFGLVLVITSTFMYSSRRVL